MTHSARWIGKLGSTLMVGVPLAVVLAREVPGRHVTLEAELVEQLVLNRRPLAHHGVTLRTKRIESPLQAGGNDAFFNTIHPFQTKVSHLRSLESGHSYKMPGA